ncbi:inositol-3-phosphate synthase [Candidatus Bathycorpusculum sp.]|uniref:inositol-3-phosphate synthase n=1 Tax=Candidatus Bathycorpusculum sp. TaxID=2994959 RepID=UPI002830D077|nr:inositol-3-phosphate synthase [Candidatus Termitimicrobium sp.]MCL2432522.1 inositol-3-phosphate synthase [Candidatus Termitimicrobium sp.]
MPQIRVAIVGVGNSACTLVQGTQYYKDAKETESVPGLMHVNFGGYHIRDIVFVAAFEVNKDKIGNDLSEAIWVKPNVCEKFSDVPYLGVKVSPAPILDGVAAHMRETFNVYDGSATKESVVQTLKDTKAEVIVNYLPVGSHDAARFYAQCALDAGCAFVNCMPEFIGSDATGEWPKKFEAAGLPVLGDDIKSQVGATILHRNLVRLCIDRGVIVDETYQLNLGGDTDFQNMTEENRLKSKRISKTEAVTSLVPYALPTRIGPSDYVEFLKNKKICYINLKGRKFGNRPINISVKLEVEDSPNSGGVVIDLIRAAKIALDRKISGALLSMPAYAFKHPPQQIPDSQAHQWTEEWIAGKRER